VRDGAPVFANGPQVVPPFSPLSTILTPAEQAFSPLSRGLFYWHSSPLHSMHIMVFCSGGLGTLAGVLRFCGFTPQLCFLTRFLSHSLGWLFTHLLSLRDRRCTSYNLSFRCPAFPASFFRNQSLLETFSLTVSTLDVWFQEDGKTSQCVLFRRPLFPPLISLSTTSPSFQRTSVLPPSST